MVSLSLINSSLTLLHLIGLGVSIYAYIIELAIEKDENYQPMCDISEHVSCTKAFKSEYGKGFGLVGSLLGEDHILNQPNSLLGMFYYSLMATLAQTNSPLLTKGSLIAAVLATCSAIYLAYILYFILYDLCVVCVSLYVVNILVLLLTIYKLKNVSVAEKKNKMKKRN